MKKDYKERIRIFELEIAKSIKELGDLETKIKDNLPDDALGVKFIKDRHKELTTRVKQSQHSLSQIKQHLEIKDIEH